MTVGKWTRSKRQDLGKWKYWQNLMRQILIWQNQKFSVMAFLCSWFFKRWANYWIHQCESWTFCGHTHTVRIKGNQSTLMPCIECNKRLYNKFFNLLNTKQPSIWKFIKTVEARLNCCMLNDRAKCARRSTKEYCPPILVLYPTHIEPLEVLSLNIASLRCEAR